MQMGVSSVGRASPLYEERARGARLSLDGPITQRKNRCVEGLLPAIALPSLVHLRFSATWKGGRWSSVAQREITAPPCVEGAENVPPPKIHAALPH